MTFPGSLLQVSGLLSPRALGRIGGDPECYVLVIKLTMLHAVKEWYGEKAASEYLLSALRFLAQGLHGEDRLFQWSRDVLMAVIRRHISYAAVRMEIARFLLNSPQHLVEQGGRKTMLAIATSFDLLAVAQFSGMDELMGAFKARLFAAA
jgi:hypothetical protein